MPSKHEALSSNLSATKKKKGGWNIHEKYGRKKQGNLEVE
jgi:hypothetical protein